MLKTNSKKARENCREYFNAMLEDYENGLISMAEDFVNASTDSKGRIIYRTIQEAFTETIVKGYFVYSDLARTVLASILDETKDEADKYDIEKVYFVLGAMLYWEFSKECAKANINYVNMFNWYW